MDYPAYSEELFYDKAGNRARRLVGGEEELYQYDPRNRLMALTRGGVTTPFQYDNAATCSKTTSKVQLRRLQPDGEGGDL